MGITMIATGGVPGNRSVLLFYPEGRTYSPPALRAVVSLPSVGPCALRGGLRSLRRAPDNATEPAGVGRHCLYGWQIGLRPVCSFAANCCPLSGQPAIRLRKPATGSFVAAMDDATRHRPFSFVCAKRNKTAPCREQKGRDPLWQSIIWKLRL